MNRFRNDIANDSGIFERKKVLDKNLQRMSLYRSVDVSQNDQSNPVTDYKYTNDRMKSNFHHPYEWNKEFQTNPKKDNDPGNIA